jgi:hypothetical protein
MALPCQHPLVPQAYAMASMIRCVTRLFVVLPLLCPLLHGVMTPAELRVLSLKEPQEIDRQPVLSNEMNARQSDYRVLAASSPELLVKDQGDLWDRTR